MREQARALTGWTADYQNGYGWIKFRFDRNRHDDAMKVVFGKAGPFNWKQAVRLCDHAPRPRRRSSPASSGATSSPSPPDDETQAALEALYVQSGLLHAPGAGARSSSTRSSTRDRGW